MYLKQKKKRKGCKINVKSQIIFSFEINKSLAIRPTKTLTENENLKREMKKQEGLNS